MNYFFDLDGTLADTDRDIREAWRAALDEMGIVCENFERDFVAGPPIEVMAEKLFPGRYTPQLGLELKRRFGVHYDQDGFPNTKEYPGVLERVKELKKPCNQVFIATNKRYAGAKKMAEKFGWNRIFDGIYASDMYAEDPAVGKLTKTGLLGKILADRGLFAAESVMIGDTSSDFIAAKETGMKSIGVAWGYGTAEELAMADIVVNDMKEIS